MDADTRIALESRFAPKDREKATELLESISLAHVMAESETNLRNTRLAALTLSAGDLNELARLVEHAKEDFRDVVYWASLRE